MNCVYEPNQAENKFIPQYVKTKNAEISAYAIQNVMDDLKKLNITEMFKIGTDLAKKDTAFMEYKICPAISKTIDFGMQKYMPEIIALTLGSFTVGAVVGANWDSIKKLINK